MRSALLAASVATGFLTLALETAYSQASPTKPVAPPSPPVQPINPPPKPPVPPVKPVWAPKPREDYRIQLERFRESTEERRELGNLSNSDYKQAIRQYRDGIRSYRAVRE